MMEHKKIDKDYWLNFGYELYDSGLDTIRKEINGVNNYVNGLLAFYGAISILGSIYNEIDDFWHYFLIILPILIIKTIDWYADVFSKPQPIEFFPESPQSCEWARDEFFEQGKTHLKRMKMFALISTILVLIAFTYINWVGIKVKKAEDKKNEKIEVLTKKKDSMQEAIAEYTGTISGLAKLKRYNFIVKYVPDDKEVILIGHFPANEVVRIVISDGGNENILHCENKIVDADGNLEMTVQLDKLKTKIYATVQYALGDEEKRTIRKHLSINN